MKNIKPEAGFRTQEEALVGGKLAEIFNQNPASVEGKLENFTKYIKRQRLTRLFALYEIFKKILHVKGSIVECGVYDGFTLMAWAQISSVMEPVNLTRRIYGFDTFEGLLGVSEKDYNDTMDVSNGQLNCNSYQELLDILKVYDSNRFIGHIEKVQLIKGDVKNTIPEFMEKNKHLLVSLLFLDMDLYEPTKTALEYFYPKMPKGSIIVFDELDNPIWPGETQALMDTIGIGKLKIERMEFDPYIGFAVVE